MLIGGVQAFTLADFPGRPAAIVFTQGCNFRCPCCHNRALWPLAPKERPWGGPEGLFGFLARRRGLLEGVVVTGGEPTLQPDLAAFLRRVKAMGLSVKLDTNGSRPGVIENLIKAHLIDAIAMDVKAPPDRYPSLCGLPVDTDAVARSIGLIAASGLPHHFRTTFDRTRLSPEDIAAIRNALPPGSPHRVQPCRDAGRLTRASSVDVGLDREHENDVLQGGEKRRSADLPRCNGPLSDRR
jgi:pyruvate formate lyase activating enzyme